MVTVIMICFNVAPFFEKAIKSVLSQTYPHMEYVVINGGSPDGTKEITSAYQNNISIFISKPDNGIYNATNNGLKASKGDIIFFSMPMIIPMNIETIK